MSYGSNEQVKNEEEKYWEALRELVSVKLNKKPEECTDIEILEFQEKMTEQLKQNQA